MIYKHCFTGYVFIWKKIENMAPRKKNPKEPKNNLKCKGSRITKACVKKMPIVTRGKTKKLREDVFKQCEIKEAVLMKNLRNHSLSLKLSFISDLIEMNSKIYTPFNPPLFVLWQKGTTKTFLDDIFENVNNHKITSLSNLCLCSEIISEANLFINKVKRRIPKNRRIKKIFKKYFSELIYFIFF